MELLSGYASSDDGEADVSDSEIKPKVNRAIAPKMADRRYLQAAPTPSILASMAISNKTNKNNNNNNNSTAISLYKNSNKSQNSSQLILTNNPLKSTLLTPLQGPTPSAQVDSSRKLSRSQIGTVQGNVTFDADTFEEQRKNFQRSGVALGPDERGTVVRRTSYGFSRKRYNYKGDLLYDDHGAAMLAQEERSKSKLETETSPENKRSKKEVLVHDSDDEITYGIWGPPTSEEMNHRNDNLTAVEKVGGVTADLPEEIRAERAHLVERDRRKGILKDGDGEEGVEGRENRDFDKLVERKMSHLLPPRMDGEDPQPMEPETTFHRPPEEEYNYKNEPWTTPPTEFKTRCEFGDVDHHRCYVPKKCVSRMTGHTKGVHRIRLSPDTGHLLLSGGLDGKCKVWSVQTKRLMRTYEGHTAAVRDVQFNRDGSKFLSASFDRFIRLWNTRTGEVEGTFTNRRVPYVVKFYPKDDRTFVAGCSDNKIVAYSTETGEVTQEYDHHLAPVNTITFVESEGMKMVTSSDDKKILVWEWDIGVPIKYISDPTMHSIPVITLHPTGGFLAGQSLDNRIVVYQGSGKFGLQRKKVFEGHQVAGYACDVAISPDGQFLCSGDGHGKVCFWEWRRHKMLQKYRAHENGPTIGCVWHPTLPSTVFTCGWDGVIKMWQ